MIITLFQILTKNEKNHIHICVFNIVSNSCICFSYKTVEYNNIDTSEKKRKTDLFR